VSEGSGGNGSQDSAGDCPVLGSPNEISAGQFQFTDPQATNDRQRFYRVRSP